MGGQNLTHAALSPCLIVSRNCQQMSIFNAQLGNFGLYFAIVVFVHHFCLRRGKDELRVRLFAFLQLVKNTILFHANLGQFISDCFKLRRMIASKHVILVLQSANAVLE
mmetsp:Transcript_66956/g.193505  ORF Transcript_66956/g.193505 Transcript_66956/m.193505 type:complete len:109 (-) Transcript_66956:503-829(-)